MNVGGTIEAKLAGLLLVDPEAFSDLDPSDSSLAMSHVTYASCIIHSCQLKIQIQRSGHCGCSRFIEPLRSRIKGRSSIMTLIFCSIGSRWRTILVAGYCVHFTLFVSFSHCLLALFFHDLIECEVYVSLIPSLAFLCASLNLMTSEWQLRRSRSTRDAVIRFRCDPDSERTIHSDPDSSTTTRRQPLDSFAFSRACIEM